MPTVHKNVGGDSVVSKLRGSCSKKRLRDDVAVPARYRNRPSPVRVAIYRVWEKSSDLGLTRATARVLQAIIASGVSSSDPYAPVFAKKSTIAKLADCSEVTVYRAMTQLEKKGLIVRNSQKRLEDGMLDIGLVQITELLGVIAGLVSNASDDSSILVNNKGQASETRPTKSEMLVSEEFQPGEADGSSNAPTSWSEDSPSAPENSGLGDESEVQLIDGLKDGPIYTGEHRVYPKASVNYQSTRSGFVRLDGRSVAQELVWLITEKRLTYGQLFKLQTLARQVPGQQLADFVAYRSERIKQLTTTNDCYRYIKKFIDEGIDARYLCSERAKKQHRAKRTTQRKHVEDAVLTWAKAFDGRVLVSKATGKAYLVHASSRTIELVQDGQLTNKSMKLDRRFMRAVQAGSLVPQQAPHKAIDDVAVRTVKRLRTEEEYQRAESSLAAMKALLAKSSNHAPGRRK